MKNKLLSLWNRPKVQYPAVFAYTVLSFLYAFYFPNAVLSLILFMGSIFLIYASRMSTKLKLLAGGVILLVLMPLIGTKSSYYLDVATQVGIYVALALGLNITVGYAGLFNLGYVAFYAIGAYTYGLFATAQANNFIPGNMFPLGGYWFWLCILVVLVLTTGVGFLLGLPVIRVRGDYLAIVTLGFGEIVRLLFNNMDKPINITNGPKGIAPIAPPQLFGLTLDKPIHFYLIVLCLVGLIIVVSIRLEKSKLGRAWTAIREDEMAAKAIGIPIVRTKLLSFAMSAAFAGVMGVVFAAKQGYIDPSCFTLMESFLILSMVILGGMGSIPGAIVGATLVSVLNLQILKTLSEFFGHLRVSGILPIPDQLDPAKYERLFFGLILIVMMIVRPDGILPVKKKPLTLTRKDVPGKQTAGPGL